MRTITLPARKEMLRRLMTVDDAPYLVRYLYPRFLQYAGQSMYAEGVAVALTGEILACRREMPLHIPSDTVQQLPDFIGALVRDRRVRQEVLEHLQQG